MATTIIPETEEMLSVQEIDDILSEPLRDCGATVAFLGGGYVQADWAQILYCKDSGLESKTGENDGL